MPDPVNWEVHHCNTYSGMESARNGSQNPLLGARFCLQSQVAEDGDSTVRVHFEVLAGNEKSHPLASLSFLRLWYWILC